MVTVNTNSQVSRSSTLTDSQYSLKFLPFVPAYAATQRLSHLLAQTRSSRIGRAGARSYVNYINIKVRLAGYIRLGGETYPPSSRSPSRPNPALFTNTSTRPHIATASSTVALMASLPAVTSSCKSRRLLHCSILLELELLRLS